LEPTPPAQSASRRFFRWVSYLCLSHDTRSRLRGCVFSVPVLAMPFPFNPKMSNFVSFLFPQLPPCRPFCEPKPVSVPGSNFLPVSLHLYVPEACRLFFFDDERSRHPHAPPPPYRRQNFPFPPLLLTPWRFSCGRCFSFLRISCPISRAPSFSPHPIFFPSCCRFCFPEASPVFSLLFPFSRFFAVGACLGIVPVFPGPQVSSSFSFVCLC